MVTITALVQVPLMLLGSIVAAPSAPVTATWVAPVSPVIIERAFQAPAGPYSPGHRGVDIRARPGETVVSAGPGLVRYAGRLAGRWVVSIDHPRGLPPLPPGLWRTTYESVRPWVAAGDSVAAGQPIGVLSGGGHCACLHWGLRSRGSYVDPLLVLRRPVVLKPWR